MWEAPMRQCLTGAALLALSIIALLHHAQAEPLPTEIGACSNTTVTDIGYRLGAPARAAPSALTMAACKSPTTTFRRFIALRSATR
jgi:hypothetical protein